MARIPLYTGTQRLTTEPSAVKESPQVAGQVSRDLQAVGEVVSKATEGIRQAYDFQQEGSFKLKALETSDQIIQMSQQDGDNTGDETKYISEFSRQKSEALKIIGNPASKAKAELEWDLQQAQTMTRVRATLRTNMVKKGLANLDKQNEYFASEIANAKTPEDAQYWIDIKDKNIDTYVSENFKDADDAQKMKTNTTNESKFANYQTQVSLNPYDTIKNIDKYGFDQDYKDKAVRYYNQVINQIQKGNEDDYTNQIVNGEDPANLRELVKIDANKGRVSNNYALAFLKKEPSVIKPTELQKVVKATELQERAAIMQKKVKSIFRKPDFKMLAQYRSDVINAASSEHITSSEMKSFLSFTTDRFAQVQPFDKAINTLKGTSQLYATAQGQAEAKSQMYGELYERIGKGEDPQVAALAIIKDRTLTEAGNLQAAINAPGKIVVIRKSDNKRIRIPEDRFDVKRYERIK